MALVVGFVYDEETVSVAELVKIRDVRIVAGAYRVEVIFLDHRKVTLYVIDIDDEPRPGVGLVAVYAAQFYFFTVDVQNTVFNMDFPQADLFRDRLPVCFQDEAVQVWLLAVPQDRVRDPERHVV